MLTRLALQLLGEVVVPKNQNTSHQILPT